MDIAALQAHTELVKAQRDIIVAEQGNWLTRLPRPIMGLSAAAVIAKILVYDMVFQKLTHGFTDPLEPTTASLVGVIVGGYFLDSAFGKRK